MGLLLVWTFCGNAQFPIFSGEFPESVQKLCLSTKFRHQEIRWNYSIFRSVRHFVNIEMIIVNLCNDCWNDVLRECFGTLYLLFLSHRLRYDTLFKKLRQTTAWKIRDIFDFADTTVRLGDYFNFPRSCLEAQTFRNLKSLILWANYSFLLVTEKQQDK